MKISIALAMFALVCLSAFAGEPDAPTAVLEPARSIFSVELGFVSDGHDGQGYAGSIRSATFFNDGPLYYGFSSLFGNFVTTREAFFETGLLVGYNRSLGDSGLSLDVFLDLLATGGRIDQETLTYRGEAPALHLGLSLGFLALSDIDCTVSVAPVIRPYNLQARTWDFSRSYTIVSFAVRLKSYALVEEHQWSESVITTNTREGNL
ncbi:MAG: hypothetical protein E4H09_02585 [Spirochaetales bacterium]|nr:MAG: hypothetical protein E4H09_02585 [Spirochaetales bacterium]